MRRHFAPELSRLILTACVAAAFLSLRRPALFLFFFPLFFATLLAWREQVKKRREQKFKEMVKAELPLVIELLSLSVSAGQSPAISLERTSMMSSGPLGAAMRTAVQKMHEGCSFISAMDKLKRELDVPAVDRAVDSIILGVERGTSLNEVLNAQALDVREEYRRSLIEHSAKAEIAMMVPIVFLIMPITILFALFPSLYSLTSAS